MEKSVFIELECLTYYDKEENEFFYLSHEDDVKKATIKLKYICMDETFSFSTEWLPNLEIDATRVEFFDRTCMYVRNKVEDIAKALDAVITFVKPEKTI